jgi:uncharacterized protein (DUF885 family)
MTELHTLADEYYAHALSESPVAMMWSGKLDHLADWDDFTPAGAAERREKNLAFARRAEAIDPGDDLNALAIRDIVLNNALAAARGEQWKTPLFHVNPKMGMFEMLLSFVDNFALHTAEDGEAYLQKLRGLPGALAQIADVARASADDGIVALARHLSATADSVARYLATPAGRDERLCAQLPPDHIDGEAKAAWTAERNRIVGQQVRPALAQYESALRDLAKQGMPDVKPGLTYLPGGDAAYRSLMWSHLLLDKDPHEVHQLGLDQIATLEDEYRELAGPMLGTTDIKEIYARLRDDMSLKYTAAEPLIADAELALKKADAAAPDWFGKVPTTPCLAEATEYGAMAYYSSPDPAIGKVGKFFFNTSHPQAWSTYELEAITYHEGIPGHHLQLALCAENLDAHIIQREGFNTAFAEGWGLYSERLADEMGLYSSPLSRIGMLSADSLRACRLVVDTGIHALGWSREEAIQYVMDHSPMDRSHIEQEVDRYIGLPAQALAYMVGRLEIQDIRRQAESRDGFDLKDFHDRLLGYGGVPLSTARKIVLG